jgi:Xaa-Pro aminopeptidase
VSEPSRADRLAALLPGRGVDVLLVTHPTNVRYLTGYTGSNGLALVGADVRVFLTDFRYVTQASDQVEGFERLEGERDLIGNVAEHLPDGPVRLGFDDGHTSVANHTRLREELPDRVELVAAGGLVEELRAVKDAGELAHLRAAAGIADAALTATLARGLAGRTEIAVAIDLEHEMRVRGAEQASFSSIVASGAHGARPHAEPRDVEIPRGVLVTIDWGARVAGYHSDCTRTVATGDPGEAAREVYEIVRRAQERSLADVAPGKRGADVDAVARDVIAASGHGEHFGHGLGHGVGLDVHEAPRLAKRDSDAVLEPGNVVTVEPGVYVPGELGVRIEDLVVVTEGGHEVLSSLPKSLEYVE